ncbi:MAG: hypothetical protein A2143_00640 [Gallionellales bacterium RBG_16_57_15]|nr:MAG: hypothetical protein A2143_00640 [Gallionellales bacterium RBG_16_57_15]
MKTLGQRLKECRDDMSATLGRRVTQDEVAKRARMKQASLSDLENDLYPTSAFIPALAEYYGVRALWLADGTGRKNQPIKLTEEQMEWLAMQEKLDAEGRKAVFNHGNSLAQSTEKKQNNGTQ